jgi:hypothetical protein
MSGAPMAHERNLKTVGPCSCWVLPGVLPLLPPHPALPFP